METLINGLILLVVFLALFSGHWLPWRVMPALVDARGDLKRVPAYVYGLICILAGFAAWCIMRVQLGMPSVPVWEAFTWLELDTCAAGAGTVMPRVIRWVLEQQALRGDMEDLKRSNGKTRSGSD
jgi:hypothetical protein